jgi:hypothetical protein
MVSRIQHTTFTPDFHCCRGCDEGSAVINNVNKFGRFLPKNNKAILPLLYSKCVKAGRTPSSKSILGFEK